MRTIDLSTENPMHKGRKKPKKRTKESLKKRISNFHPEESHG